MNDESNRDLFDLTHFGWVLDAEGYWYKPVEEKADET